MSKHVDTPDRHPPLISKGDIMLIIAAIPYSGITRMTNAHQSKRPPGFELVSLKQLCERNGVRSPNPWATGMADGPMWDEVAGLIEKQSPSTIVVGALPFVERFQPSVAATWIPDSIGIYEALSVQKKINRGQPHGTIEDIKMFIARTRHLAEALKQTPAKTLPDALSQAQKEIHRRREAAKAFASIPEGTP